MNLNFILYHTIVKVEQVYKGTVTSVGEISNPYGDNPTLYLKVPMTFHNLSAVMNEWNRYMDGCEKNDYDYFDLRK